MAGTQVVQAPAQFGRPEDADATKEPEVSQVVLVHDERRNPACARQRRRRDEGVPPTVVRSRPDEATRRHLPALPDAAQATLDQPIEPVQEQAAAWHIARPAPAWVAGELHIWTVARS